MCKFFGVSRSGYYAYLKSAKKDRDQELAIMIRQCQKETDHTYGYRRVCLWLDRKGIRANHKRVFRVMNRYGLFSEIRRRRKYQQMTEQLHRYPNLLNREFSAKQPNEKWVTDISYIQTKEGVLYLSMIRDLYDNSIVAYKTAAQQTVNLVLDTIRLAMKKEKRKVAAELQLHSDQGFQYTSREYFNLAQSYGITPSMSRRGNCYDNAMAENFFSILKTECIYRRKPKTINEAQNMIDDYIHFYNCERIQTKTGVAPLMLRHSA
jgi:transposase InsO family protein